MKNDWIILNNQRLNKETVKKLGNGVVLIAISFGPRATFFQKVEKTCIIG